MNETDALMELIPKKKRGRKPKTIKPKKRQMTKAKYFQLSDENRAWVLEQSLTTGHPLSVVVDEALRALRTGEKFVLERHVPAYVRRALEMKERREEKIKKLMQK